MLDAKDENLNAMALLGLEPEAAEEVLAFRVVVTAAPRAMAFAKDISDLLARTLTVVEVGEQADLEVAVCEMAQTSAAAALLVRLDDHALTVAAARIIEPYYAETPILTRRIAACYVAGRVIGWATKSDRYSAEPDPFVVKFAALGLAPELLAQPIDLNDTVLVGAGGVGNGFVWGLEALDVSGSLTVLDPKNVSDGNLNRCLFFGEDDRGKPKAIQLAKNANLPNLKLVPKVATFDQLINERGRVGLAISTVDSREVRRSIQSGLPWQVLDASTTGISEVVVHSHGQPAAGACLACIYEHIPQEDERARDVAQALGLEVPDLKRGFIDLETGKKIIRAHPELEIEAILGRAFDTLFKERCGQGALLSTGGEQVFAPFAFVSNLAGLLLALELVRLTHLKSWPEASHYMALDPWRPPHARLRRHRSRSATCEHCRSPIVHKTMRRLWKDRFEETV